MRLIKNTLDRPYCFNFNTQITVRGRQSTTLSGPLLSLFKRAAPLRSRRARDRLRIPHTTCLTSSSIDWAKDPMVSFSSTSLVVVGSLLLGSVMATLQNQVQRGQVRTPGRPRVLGQAADDFPPNLLFGQLLALIVVCTVAPSCWNQQELHIPRQWGAFVHRSVLLFEVFTWAFTCKLQGQNFQWLSMVTGA